MLHRYCCVPLAMASSFGDHVLFPRVLGGEETQEVQGQGQISFILAGWLASSPACPDLRPDLGTFWGLSDPIYKAQGQGVLYGPGALSVVLLG